MTEYMIFCDDVVMEHFKNNTEKGALLDFEKKSKMNLESPVFDKMRLVELKPIKAQLFTMGDINVQTNTEMVEKSANESNTKSK